MTVQELKFSRPGDVLEDPQGPDDPLTEEEKKAAQPKEVRASYKIEVHFGKNRSVSELKPSVGAMLVFESGKHYHGGGDDKMYWCGYNDCDRPIKSEFFGAYSVVCPHCHRESFLDPVGKEDSIRNAKNQGMAASELRALPVCVGEKLFNLPPSKLGRLIEKVWFKLGCDADIYLKYHPKDIRVQVQHMTNTEVAKQLTGARKARAPGIYPLHRILKDTENGAVPWKRFRDFVVA